MRPFTGPTCINGTPAEWTPEIRAKWDALAEPAVSNEYGALVRADHPAYFTPRPYRNEYDRGSDREGFTYTAYFERGRDVCQVTIARHPLQYACALCRFVTTELAAGGPNLPGHGTGGEQCPGSYHPAGWTRQVIR